MYLIRKILFIILLFITLIYVTNITAIPEEIFLFEGEKYTLDTILGVYKKKEEVITASLNTEDNNVLKEETIHLSLLNIFNVKDINVKVIEEAKVVPLR